MLWKLARYNWTFLVHGGAGFRSWAYRSPGVARNYEPMYVIKWDRKEWHLGRVDRGDK